jgi:hypothetical protein
LLLTPRRQQRGPFHYSDGLLAAGRLRVPIAPSLAPRIEGSTWAEDGEIRVAVTVSSPFGGLVLGYNATVRADAKT